MQRFVHGFLFGVAATIAMSIVMGFGQWAGISPLPSPVPLALMSTLFGGRASEPIIMSAALVAHLTYGGFWAGAIATRTYPVTVWSGLVLGLFLWLLMQVIFLPILGWGPFGAAVAPAIAAATLVPHLVYGITLGALMDREAAAANA